MAALAKVFVAAGFQNVRTFIASGNVVFDSSADDAGALAKKIERRLHRAFGHEVTVVVLTLQELMSMVKRHPFKHVASQKDAMLCVVFFAAEPRQVKLPIISNSENLEVFAARDGAAFVVCRRKKNGWFGFPNNFVEKQFGVAATTRQWRTIEKLVTFARAN